MVKSYKYDQSQYVEWLDRAKEDYLTAKSSVGVSLRNSAYLIQQCCEKLLKGYLVFHNVTIDFTHDLVMLYDKCLEYNLVLDESLKKDLFLITTFETESRYLSTYVFSNNDIEVGFNVADTLMDCVSKLTGYQFI